MHNQFDYDNIYELVDRETNLKVLNALEQNALYIAIDAKNLSIIEALLKYYIDISIQDKENNTIRSYLNKTNY